MDLSAYSAKETIRDGSVIEIRAIRPDDREEAKKTKDRVSDNLLYRRFFTPKRMFTQKEINYLMDVDFVKQVALVVVLEEAGRPIIAGGRYAADGPGSAELAFAVEDVHQGKGIASLLLRHLISIARGAGLKELHADVLPENSAMMKVFERCGLEVSKAIDPWTVQFTHKL